MAAVRCFRDARGNATLGVNRAERSNSLTVDLPLRKWEAYESRLLSQAIARRRPQRTTPETTAIKVAKQLACNNQALASCVDDFEPPPVKVLLAQPKWSVPMELTEQLQHRAVSPTPSPIDR